MLCSPWQGVDYAYQLELKRQMLTESMARPELGLAVTDMVGAPSPLGYRNKLEFALLAGEERHLQLAFHARGSDTQLVALPDGCALGSEAMNKAALALLEKINAYKIAGYIDSVTIRQSQTDGKIVAVVALHQKAKRDWSDLKIPELAGVVVTLVRKDGRHEKLWQTDETELTEMVGGVELRYPYDGFFQVNLPCFNGALEQIIDAVPEGSKVVDLYGGAGTIGLPVARKARRVVGVEIDPESVDQANANAARAGLANYEAMAVSAERMSADVLRDVDLVIVDPPRAGLGRRVVDMLLEAAPQRIIYLSCNPVTQARDLILLKDAYKTSGVTGFDFYPGTLHLESLAILDRVQA
jgi:23S rRNA (uracil1939-C5)-methyltransferase